MNCLIQNFKAFRHLKLKSGFIQMRCVYPAILVQRRFLKCEYLGLLIDLLKITFATCIVFPTYKLHNGC